MRFNISYEMILGVATLVTITGLVAGWYPSDENGVESNFATIFYCIFALINLIGIIAYAWAKAKDEL